MTGIDPGLNRTWETARALVGGRIRAICAVAAGRNSRIFRVDTAEGIYALKEYPMREDDPRDRLGTEALALELMERHGIDRVPRLLAVDRQGGCALLSWLDGRAVTAIGEADVDAAVDFLGSLHAIRMVADFAPDRLASEACLSGAAITRQIETRLARLRM